MSRRDFLARASALGGGAVLASWAGPIIERAYGSGPVAGSLDDIEHFVLLMQENRSFDHYYGTMSGVRGFSDPSPAYQQRGYTPGKGPDPNGVLLPFRLDTTRGATLDGDAINDPTHDWGPQHRAWNNGAMDQWVTEHLAIDGNGNGPATMGHYTRADIPIHYDIADAFTICDSYFCSVLGPTDPNRLYWISGTIDPDGQHGGPLLNTPTTVPKNVYSWQTYPEALENAGVSWKVYTNKSVPIISGVLLSGMLGAFKNFQNTKTDLYKRGIAPTFPTNFRTDVANNTLPAVSWIIPSLITCEHPALPPQEGAVGMLQVLDILMSNPKVWEKTALIISYDENGGFFDHVTPPTAPPGTPGEYVTVPNLAGIATSEGIRGPIGLGFRVPCTIISPFSRGGLVSSDAFDHTSQLRLLEKRFGVPVPNLSAWRRATVGDMSTAFNFAGGLNTTLPKFPNPTPAALLALVEGNANILLGTLGKGIPYPVPPNSMPTQETTPVRGRPQQ
jgi:phospholipase C